MEIVAGRDIEVTKLHGDRTAVSVGQIFVSCCIGDTNWTAT